tara:strand:+ start:238 stop:417 length:180 start_codon:yes stop_codon:yes gene_type:complete
MVSLASIVRRIDQIGKRGKNKENDPEICICLALTIGMDLMYKFHIGGQERLVLGVTVCN